MSRTRSQTLADALDLKRTLSTAELAAFSRVVGELQRESFSLTSNAIVRGMVRRFVADLSAKSSAEAVSAVHDALRVAPGGIS